MAIRKRIESHIERFVFFICMRSKWVLSLITIFFLSISTGIMNISIDASTEAFLHPNDPILKRYNEFKDQFGREDLVLIAIEAKNIFEVETLKKIKLLHDTIEENVPNINEINSLINARVTYADSKMLVVGELLEDWPKKSQDLVKIRNLVNSNPLFINQLISKDGLVTTLTISLNTYSSGSQ